MLIFTGITVYKLHNRKPQFYTHGKFYAAVHEILQEKPKSFQTILKIGAVMINDSVVSSNEKVIAYFEKSLKSEQLIPGDIIVFEQKPDFIKERSSPYDFDYKRYMSGKGIYRQVYLADSRWIKTVYSSGKSFSVAAEKVRLKLMNIYRSQNITNRQFEVLSALTLGYSRGLDPETKRVFSSAGAMHVLAVSGLHAGIIFLAVNFVFGFLKKRKRGKYAYMVIAVVSLWTFAFITGLAPSVKRAVTMFTFLVIGENLKRQQNTYNSMAASAFLLLFINPNNLFEAGFQLSYSAVFGIVFLQPRIAALLEVKNKVLLFFWNLFAVSVAAQIATFPISTYYFSQFPTFFWLSNLLVIPAAFILIPLGFSLLFLHWIPVFAKCVSIIIKFLITQFMNYLGFIESLPGSVLEVVISGNQLVVLIASVILASVFISSKRAFYFKGVVVSFLFLIVVITYENINRNMGREILIYNNSGSVLIQLVYGKSSYVVLENESHINDFNINSAENIKRKLRLDAPVIIHQDRFFNDDFLFVKNGMIVFDDKIISNGVLDYNIDNSPVMSYLIDPSSENLSKIKDNPKITVISSAVSHTSDYDFNGSIYFLAESGAFRKKWYSCFD